MKDHQGVKQVFILFISFFKIGLFTIGGGMAMIPLIERIVVEEKKWLSEKEMTDCIALSQAMPGVIAVNVATYIGKKKQGVLGAIFATLGVVLPSFIIIILMVHLLNAVGENRYIHGAFIGIKAAVCGLVCVTLFKMGKKVLRDPFAWILSIIGFCGIIFLQISAVWVVCASILLGIFYYKWIRDWRGHHG